MKPITFTVDYEWKPWACEICKVFGHLCKALVEAPTLLEEDMLKIKNKKGVLQACSSLIIIVEGVTSHSIVTVAKPR